ncbi:hypothetical protein BKA69DRAFT_732447 [Paraphysoderma sedebokerense]|nr:hypothetical protein BKA69DRAFT_732447 [Paraphysoderma sedebokerense]
MHSRCLQPENPAPRPPSSFYRLLVQVIKTPESYILENIGLDAVMYLRLTVLCIKFTFVAMLLIPVILIPIHTSSTPTLPPNGPKGTAVASTRALDRYSILSVPSGSSLFWFHFILTYVVSLSVYYLTYTNYHYYVQLVRNFLLSKAKKGEVQLRTIMIRGVPSEMRSEEALHDYFSKLNLGAVESVVLVRQLTKLQRKIDRRQNALRDLEINHMKLAKEYYTKKMRPWWDIFGIWSLIKVSVLNMCKGVEKCAAWIGTSSIFKSIESFYENHLSCRGRRRRKRNQSPERKRGRKRTEEFISNGDTEYPDNHRLDTVRSNRSNHSNPQRLDKSFLSLSTKKASSVSLIDTSPPTPDSYLTLDKIGDTPILPANRAPSSLSWDFLLNPSLRSQLEDLQPQHYTKYLGCVPTGRQVISIDHYYKKLVHYDRQVQRLRDLEENKHLYKPTSTAFITFRSPVAAAICSQSLTLSWDSATVKQAPEPRDIIWSAFALSSRRFRPLLRSFFNALVTCLIFIWVIPLYVVVALVNVDNLAVYLPFLRPVLNGSTLNQSFLQIILPTITATLCNAVIPYFLLFLARFQAFYSTGALMTSVTVRYYQFMLFNVLLVFSMSQTLLASVFQLFFIPGVNFPGLDTNTIGNILTTVAQALPQGANFYLNYVIFQANFHALELLQINWGVFLSLITTSRWFSPTPRDYFKATRPWQFAYYWYYPSLVLILVISITYSLIQPLILPFAFAYYIFAYAVFKHQFMYAYVTPYERNGKMWIRAVNWILYGMILFQITMAGLLALNRNFVAAGLLLPLPGFTLWLKYYFDKFLKPKCGYIPVDAQTKEEHIGLLEKEHSPGKHSDDSERGGKRRNKEQKARKRASSLYEIEGQDRSRSFGMKERVFTQPIKMENGGRYYVTKRIPSLPVNSEPILVDQPMALSPVTMDYSSAESEMGSNDNIDIKERPSLKSSNSSGRKLSPLAPVQSLFTPRPDNFFLRRNSMEAEHPNPNPQLYFHPCLWQPLPQSMWLPKNPLHAGRFDLSDCTFLGEYCVSERTLRSQVEDGMHLEPGSPEVEEFRVDSDSGSSYDSEGSEDSGDRRESIVSAVSISVAKNIDKFRTWSMSVYGGSPFNSEDSALRRSMSYGMNGMEMNPRTEMAFVSGRDDDMSGGVGAASQVHPKNHIRSRSVSRHSKGKGKNTGEGEKMLYQIDDVDVEVAVE